MNYQIIKLSPILLSILLFFFITGCVEKKASPKVEPTPNSVSKNSNISSNTNVLAKNVSTQKTNREVYWDEVQNMKKKGGFSKYSISTINGENATSYAKSNRKVTINSDRIIITGWAFDERTKKHAKDVYVNIGGKLFDADYGVATPWLSRDVDSRLTNAAFTLNIKSNKLESGVHEVQLIVLTEDGSFYMHHPNMIPYGKKFMIEVI